MRALLLLSLLVTPTLLALVPTAQAQGVVATQVQVTIEDPGRALVPGRNESIPARLNYIWSAGARPAPTDPETHPNYTMPTRITLTVVQKPSWVLEAVPFPQELFVDFPFSMAPIGGNRAVVFSVNLTLDPLAPALQREEIVVEAVAEPNGNMAGATGQSQPVKLRADVVAILNVTAEPRLVLPGGRWSTVPFTVRNEGNDDVVARLNVTIKPENSEVEFPKEVSIKRGESVTVDVRIRTPWTEAELGLLALEAVPLLDEDDGTPVEAEVEIVATSAIPSPAPLLALVAAVLLFRRR